MSSDFLDSGKAPPSKLKIASDIYDFYFQVKLHQVRQSYPDSSLEEQETRVRALIAKACE